MSAPSRQLEPSRLGSEPSLEGALLVIIPDRLSDLLKKGEITDRYYNPGNLFQQVHLLLINDDSPDPKSAQRLVGDAQLTLHRLPAPNFKESFGWSSPWLRDWMNSGLALARQIQPRLIRCHGAHLNLLLAKQIKQTLGVPYLVSLHINPDEDIRRRATTWKERLIGKRLRQIEARGLKAATGVLPVYQSIVPYLKRQGITAYEVAYNVLNPTSLIRKTDYALHDPVQIVSVGRQFREKNPQNLIRAVAKLPNVHLTLIGDGLLHDQLVELVHELGIEARVTFQRAIQNDQLCRELQRFDIFAVHSEYWEISKSVLEALLVGLPLVVNRRRGNPVVELETGICLQIEDSERAYRHALERLIEDADLRAKLGQRAYEVANEHWAPEKTEARFVEIYENTLRYSKLGA